MELLLSPLLSWLSSFISWLLPALASVSAEDKGEWAEIDAVYTVYFDYTLSVWPCTNSDNCEPAADWFIKKLMLEGRGSADILGNRPRVWVTGYEPEGDNKQARKVVQCHTTSESLTWLRNASPWNKDWDSSFKSSVVTKERACLPFVAVSEVQQFLGSSAWVKWDA